MGLFLLLNPLPQQNPFYTYRQNRRAFHTLLFGSGERGTDKPARTDKRGGVDPWGRLPTGPYPLADRHHPMLRRVAAGFPGEPGLRQLPSRWILVRLLTRLEPRS